MAGMRSPMRNPMRSAISRAIDDPRMSLDNQMLAIIRKFGTDAHVYLPGASGVAVSGLPTNNYTLSDGSTGYSAIDGTAGRVLDGAGSVGAELVTNGDFSDGATGWTASPGTQISALAGAAWRIASVDGSAASVAQTALTPTAGKTYKISVEITATTGSGILIDLGGATSPSLNTVGVKEFFLTCTSTVALVVKRGGVCDTTFDNISVREVTGIHATQATTANKPALRRGVYNLLTYSQDFSNAAWTTNAVTKTSTTAQDALGGSTACLATVTLATGAHQLVSPTISQTIGLVYTQSVYVKPGSANRCQVTCGSVSFGTTCYANFSLVGSGSVLASGAGVTARIQPDRDGFYKLSITLSATATGTSSAVAVVFIDSDTATRSPSFTGNGTDSLTVCFAQSEAGTTAGDYSPTTSAAASNQSAGRYSWQFDGSNDSLALGSVPFQMSDDHCVVAGARNEKSVGAGIVFACAGPTTQRLGQIYYNAAVPICSWSDDAVNSVVLQGVAQALSSTQVISGRKVGNSFVARMNGAVMQSGTLSLGTTTIDSQSIGAHKSTPTNYFQGSIGPVILIKGTVSDADLLTLERWVAANTQAGPSF